jgi:hypothetical protein
MMSSPFPGHHELRLRRRYHVFPRWTVDRSLPRLCGAEKAIPMVATRDIGTAAARLLAEGASGKRVIELAGPREYTPRDVAAVGRIVGKPIEVQQSPEEVVVPAMMGAGMNAEWARLFHDLTHGLNANIVVWEGGPRSGGERRNCRLSYRRFSANDSSQNVHRKEEQQMGILEGKVGNCHRSRQRHWQSRVACPGDRGCGGRIGWQEQGRCCECRS